MEVPLSGVKDLDLEVMSNLKDSDLSALCLLSKNAKKFCDSDKLSHFWIQRTINNLKTKDEFAASKPENLTWREWYFQYKHIHKVLEKIRALSKSWPKLPAKEKKRQSGELCSEWLKLLHIGYVDMKTLQNIAKFNKEFLKAESCVEMFDIVAKKLESEKF